ncbi:hypothetical protein AOQ84DRAFT_382249 [Glonium stellatum]|uniref:Uncharacterized protein n=1 Tax=Glonium stellatum TaxID=574774 RepID=A0A8E2JMH3_9PEZI|nr:hypothetical protein AOQ84DRAFT_382249 [Glonium stellatum]
MVPIEDLELDGRSLASCGLDSTLEAAGFDPYLHKSGYRGCRDDESHNSADCSIADILRQ